MLAVTPTIRMRRLTRRMRLRANAAAAVAAAADRAVRRSLAMDRAAVEAFVGLGANLGDARATVLWAAAQIESLPGVTETQLSPLHRSEPVDAGGDDFCNAVLRVLTTLPAPVLMDQLQKIEHQAGRERPYRNAPRTLDLDLLLFGSATIRSPLLTVPHPRMHQRAFVLKPLADVAPSRVDAAWLQHTQGQRCERW
jgi:2-amino-4-hydroxy-6-hydroxymethyldihydropteridine diphosphokinase